MSPFCTSQFVSFSLISQNESNSVGKGKTINQRPIFAFPPTCRWRGGRAKAYWGWYSSLSRAASPPLYSIQDRRRKTPPWCEASSGLPHFQLVGIFEIGVKMPQLGTKTAKEGVKMENFAKNYVKLDIFVQKGVNPKSGGSPESRD